MKADAHYGHKDFILCLGHNGEAFKEYFLNYNECLSNDFIIEGGKQPQMLKTDIHDWRITFADTGLTSNVGVRLKSVQKYLEGEEVFMVNYSDGLSDVPMDDMLTFFEKSNKIACFLCTKPYQTFHYVHLSESGLVDSIQDTRESGLAINGGFFIFKDAIFDYIEEGEELVHEPFQRLITEEQLLAYQYDGYWRCMDTFKDKQDFDDAYARGYCPWEVWKQEKRTDSCST
jgi:glucose-1-phosphate cytidylyltransferase